MSSPQRPDPQQNIIRFPTSARARRKLLRESKDPRLRLVAALRMVCGWLLVAGVLLFSLHNYRLFTPTSLRSLVEYTVAGLRRHEGDITTINYENGIFTDGALFRSSLAYADSDALYLARPGSVTTMRCPLGYAAPAVEACGDYVLAYDRGGLSAVLANAIAPVATLSLESPIITGSLGQDGSFVLVLDESGYRTAVAVYDSSGTEIFKYRSSEYYILSAHLSPDGKTLAVLAFQQNGVALDTHVLFYHVSSGALESEAVLEDALGIALIYPSSGNVAVLADDGLYLIRRKGDAERVLTSAADDLLSFTAQRDMMAFATRSYSGSGRADLYTVRGSTLTGPCSLEEEPAALAVSATGAAVLSTAGVSVYDADLRPLWRNSDTVGARRLLLTPDGTVFALYTQNARLFTAHSERSEVLDHAP